MKTAKYSTLKEIAKYLTNMSKQNCNLGQSVDCSLPVVVIQIMAGNMPLEPAF